ncbi:MAG: PEP-CTERM sorting domain-containing protein [Fimbriimonadaceae bacterium]|nr:PEP-CTERM sorting domain-containing protein [Fimbriimonadaceae bacterium]
MKVRLLLVAALGAIAATAHADPYSWIKWNSFTSNSADGVITTSNGATAVHLSGSVNNVLSSYPSWTPVTSYRDGVVIDNAPYEGQAGSDHQIVQILTTGAYSLTFDKPVDHLAFAVWSLGQPGQAVRYTFDQDLNFIAGGPGTEYGGQSITTGSNWLEGREGNGTVVFDGPFSTLNWDIDNPESWHGFTVGLKTAQSVPEPATMAVIGLGSLALARRRKR